MPPFLSFPDASYRHSFLEALGEFQDEGRNLDLDRLSLMTHFEAYVQHLLRQASDEHREGLVPESYFWLIDDAEYIGRVSIRHYLTPGLLQFGGHIGYEIRPSKRRKGYGVTILRLGLEKAGALGIRRVLVTCDDSNIGSAKIIEANGGVLENFVLLSNRTVATWRYWIEISDSGL